MRLAWGIDDAVGEYISAHFPELTARTMLKPHVAVGFVDNQDRLVAGVALNLESAFEGSLSIYASVRNFATRPMLGTLFRFVFHEKGLARLTCQVAKPNRRARRFVEKLGFRMEGVKRRGFDGRKDAVVYGMTADDCRWLKD